MTLYALGDFCPQLPAEGQFWIAPNASVIGKVCLKTNVGIWFGATLRGDNEMITIGTDSNIQDGVTIHTDMGFPATIGQKCTIGHNAIIHGCTIGDNTLVGMGATILNGASIGKNSLVGANALITEGKTFPERSLIVGSPARVIRQLDDEAVAAITRSAEKYVCDLQRVWCSIRVSCA